VDSLSFYDVETGLLVTGLDLGAVNRSTSDDTTMRVYNNSSAYQCENVTVLIIGSAADQLWLSDDGEVFTATIEVGDIPPQSYSPIFTLRRVTGQTATEQAFTAGLRAYPADWVSPVDSTTSGVTPLDTSDS
jgi:hypothetical protein